MSFAQIAIRAWTFLWTLLALALVGNVIANAFSGNPSSVNFAIFSALWCMLAVLFGIIGAFVESLAIPIALLIGDGIALLLSLITGIVLAAKLGVHSCHNDAYLVHNNLTNGAHNMTKRCQELQASTAFFWFMAVGFAASLAVTGLGSRGSGISSRGGIRQGPSMSQV